MNKKYIIFIVILFIVLFIIYKLFKSKQKPKKIPLVKAKANAIKKLPLNTQSDIDLAKTAVHLREVDVATNLLDEVEDPELRALLLKSQVKQTKLANNSAIRTVKNDKKSILKSKLENKATIKIANKFPNIPKNEILGALKVANKITTLSPKVAKSIIKTVKKVAVPKIGGKFINKVITPKNLATVFIPGVAQARVAKAVFNKLKNVKVINKATKKVVGKIAKLNPVAFNQAIKISQGIDKKIKLFKPKVVKAEVTAAKTIAKNIVNPQGRLNELVNKNLPLSKVLGLKKSVWPAGKPLPKLPAGIKNPMEFVKGPDGQRLINPKTGQPVTKAEAAKSFIAAHPDQVAKLKQAATKKVVATATTMLAKKVVGAALMPKGGFSPGKMAAGLLFLIPGFRSLFNKIFPAPVGPFLEQNMQLLYGAGVVICSPVTIPLTLPPFLVQVMIALAIYVIMKNLQKIKDGLKNAGKAIGKAFKKF